MGKKQHHLHPFGLFRMCRWGHAPAFDQIIRKHQLAPVIETQGATEQELLDADEIFITNAIQGIQWLVGFQEKRYFCQLAKKIVELLNQYTFN